MLFKHHIPITIRKSSNQIESMSSVFIKLSKLFLIFIDQRWISDLKKIQKR